MAPAKTLQDQLLDKATELQETYKDLLEERDANRKVLRDLVRQGLLSEDQQDMVDEIYPERAPRKSKDDEGDEIGED